ncbi:Mic60p NDAI_0B04990 [Naumovozyma dairenensis CBS 421]|uniref:MICOS complex subunit MIC60 n=1 Tax=Naumovozyma dairenensis (strain ATCC 10597 / BCRC 20456 / CBS 421 / NBRC 0211 / NRRL Y-12639) TaxID=1071378 RepID=G0W6X1_NAUDC|nr:hypothetical protein NDAI_0B04990 [Naumovozyma dairenensis CBS 421]CCD23532.1 hypothetical protein NDAI_0B04990 [Naumovozyma dairenensis CBS 421]
MFQAVSSSRIPIGKTTNRLLLLRDHRYLATINSGAVSSSPFVKPKKHTFRNTIFIVTGFYLLGLTISEKYDGKFKDFFIGYVPGGKQLTDWYDSFEFNRLKEKYSSIITGRTIGIPIHRPIPKKITDDKSEQEPENEQKAKTLLTEKSIATELLKLNPIEKELNNNESPLDDQFRSIVNHFNILIKLINDQQYLLPMDQRDSIVSKYDALISDLFILNKNLDESIMKSVLQRTAEFTSQLNSQFDSNLKKHSVELNKEYNDKFTDFKSELEKRSKEQLEMELKSIEELLLQRHANEMKLLSITQVKEFNKIIEEKVSGERNGKLAHLDELDQRISEFTSSIDKLDSYLTKNETIKRLVINLENLRNKLYTNVSRSVQINKELNKIKTLIDILPNSCHDDHCCSKKHTQTLLDVTIQQLNDIATDEKILSNDQLFNRWNLLENDFKTASLLPANAGLLAHMTAKFFSNFLFTKNGISPDSKDLDAIFARVKEYLRFSQLDKALEEVVTLEGWPHVLCQEWIKETRRKLEIEALVDILDNEIKLL